MTPGESPGFQGCIGEGAAAAWAALAREGADAGVRPTLSVIASDELRHATLSWQVIGWALRRTPRVAETLRAALETWERSASGDPVEDGRLGLRRYGMLSVREERSITRSLVGTVVRPTLEALCGAHAGAESRA